MDWEGLVVISDYALANGMGEVPAGTKWIVTGYHQGLQMTSLPCTCCGLRMRISRVSEFDITVADIPHNDDRLAWNKKCKFVKPGRYLRLQTPDEPKPEYKL